MTYDEIEVLPSFELSKWFSNNHQYKTDEERPETKVCDIGVNDAPYHICKIVDKHRVCDPAYVAWTSMLRRCYSEKYLAWESNRSYHDVTVNPEWHSFMNFREWWLVNYREGYYLDKDLLTGGREYGPNACLYVPSWVNNMATDCRSVKTSGLPMGVYQIGNRYAAHIHWDRTSKRSVHLGRFATAEEAHATYLLAKICKIRRRKAELMAIHPDLLMRIIDIVYDL